VHLLRCLKHQYSTGQNVKKRTWQIQTYTSYHRFLLPHAFEISILYHAYSRTIVGCSISLTHNGSSERLHIRRFRRYHRMASFALGPVTIETTMPCGGARVTCAVTCIESDVARTHLADFPWICDTTCCTTNRTNEAWACNCRRVGDVTSWHEPWDCCRVNHCENAAAQGNKFNDYDNDGYSRILRITYIIRKFRPLTSSWVGLVGLNKDRNISGIGRFGRAWSLERRDKKMNV
jgi:hypothetical protein